MTERHRDRNAYARAQIRRIEQLISARHGSGGVPPGHYDYVRVIFDHLAQFGDAEEAIRNYARVRVAWLGQAELDRAITVALARRPMKWSARELGKTLEFRDAERAEFERRGITIAGIWPADVDDAEMERRRKAKDAERKRRERLLERRPPKPAGPPTLSTRAAALLKIVSKEPARWWHTADLATRAARLQAFRCAAGKLDTETLRRSVNRALRELVDNARVDHQPIQTKWGVPARVVRYRQAYSDALVVPAQAPVIQAYSDASLSLGRRDKRKKVAP